MWCFLHGYLRIGENVPATKKSSSGVTVSFGLSLIGLYRGSQAI